MKSRLTTSVKPAKQRSRQLGNLGEAYVILELAKKGLYATRTPGCSFDILVENGKRLEVKSATPKIRSKEIHPTLHFSFVQNIPSYEKGSATYSGYKRKQVFCDYYVLVAFDMNDQPQKYWIIPADKLAYKNGISMRPRNQPTWARYMNNWDLLL